MINISAQFIDLKFQDDEARQNNKVSDAIGKVQQLVIDNSFDS